MAETEGIEAAVNSIILQGPVFYFRHDQKKYFGSLVESGVKDELTRHYVLKLNPDMIRLYGETQWTAIDWQQRIQLRRKPLAQALHAYFSSHKNPLPVSFSFLQQITGSRNVQAADFKRKCRQALDELVSIGFLQSYSHERDRVTVKRAPPFLPASN